MLSRTRSKFDATDIPVVPAADLIAVMQLLVASGRGLALIEGLDEIEFRDIEDALWRQLDADPIRRLAVAVRFRCLICVFRDRRLRELFLTSGHRLLAEAAEVGAGQRLNMARGFNATTMLWELRALRRRAGTSERRRLRAAA